ncbi:MAG TPA: PAS domain-containing protein, partial [Polyangiaceae bacterium]|nr:PAS domain-containing protein [Polyangiaceae bacterium]
MKQSGDQGWIARVAAALAGVDASGSWTAALSVLQGLGIEVAPPDASEAWLVLERCGRRVSLTSRGPALSEADRETLSHLLLAGLARTAEQDERQRIQERMELLSAASFEGIFVHEGGVVTDANARFAELVGYEPGEVLGPHTMPRCVAPEDLPGVRQRVLEQFEGAYVITGVRKDGSRFRAELQSKQCKLGARPVRVVAVRDVTERERTSSLLRESETRLRDLAAQAFDLIVFSRDGIAVDVTGPLESVLGISRQEWVGRHLVEFVAPPSVPLVTQLFADNRTGTYEASLLHASGEYVPVEIVAMLTTLDGEPVRMGAVRDLRPARRLEHER